MSAPSPECDQANALLVDFVYGELEGSVRSNLEKHLPGCTRCQADLVALETTRRMMGANELLPAPEAGLESLLAFAGQHAGRQQAAPRPFWIRWAMAIVPVGLAAGVGLLLFGKGASGPSVLDRQGVETRGQATEVPASPSPMSAAPPPPSAPARAAGDEVAQDLAKAGSPMVSAKPSGEGPAVLDRPAKTAVAAGSSDKFEPLPTNAVTGRAHAVQATSPTPALSPAPEPSPEVPAQLARREANKGKKAEMDSPSLGALRGSAGGVGAEQEGGLGTGASASARKERADVTLEAKRDLSFGEAQDDRNQEGERSRISTKKAKASLAKAMPMAVADQPESSAAPGAPASAPPPMVAAASPVPRPAAPPAEKSVDGLASSAAQSEAPAAAGPVGANLMGGAGKAPSGWSAADRLAANGDHAAAAGRYRAIFEGAPQDPQAGTALFREGEEEGAAGNSRQAAETLTRVSTLFASSALAPQALLRAAYWARLARDEALAENLERKLISQYPSSPAAAQAEAQPQLRGVPGNAVAAPKAAARPAPSREYEDSKAATDLAR